MEREAKMGAVHQKEKKRQSCIPGAGTVDDETFATQNPRKKKASLMSLVHSAEAPELQNSWLEQSRSHFTRGPWLPNAS